jgi:hypothetical protein
MIRLNMRFYEGKDDDIIAWLESQPDQHGAQSIAVKQALKQFVSGQSVQDGRPEQPVQIDLGEIRRVVEAALDERLDGLEVAAAGDNHPHNEETEMLLDDLGAALTLEE